MTCNPMFGLLGIFLVFFAWVALEVAALVAVARVAGVLGTVLLLFLAAAVGYVLIGTEGFATTRRFAAYFERARRTGDLPPPPIAESLPRVLAGLLLMIPGFVTDALALLILLPPVRGFIVSRISRAIAAKYHDALRERGYGPVIDVEGEVVPERDETPPPPPALPPPPSPG